MSFELEALRARHNNKAIHGQDPVFPQQREGDPLIRWFGFTETLSVEDALGPFASEIEARRNVERYMQSLYTPNEEPAELCFCGAEPVPHFAGFYPYPMCESVPCLVTYICEQEGLQDKEVSLENAIRLQAELYGRSARLWDMTEYGERDPCWADSIDHSKQVLLKLKKHQKEVTLGTVEKA